MTMTIKITLPLLSLFLFMSCEAKSYKSLEAMFKSDEDNHILSPPPPPKPPKGNPSKVELKKNKAGYYEVNWKLLGEFDLKTRKKPESLEKIIGKPISIMGYMIPLDYSAKLIKEFLLVPYMPTCYHVPPPGPNMIINVKVEHLKNGLKPSYYPVKVAGVLKTIKLKESKDPYDMNGVYSLTTSLVEEVKR